MKHNRKLPQKILTKILTKIIYSDQVTNTPYANIIQHGSNYYLVIKNSLGKNPIYLQYDKTFYSLDSIDNLVEKYLDTFKVSILYIIDGAGIKWKLLVNAQGNIDNSTEYIYAFFLNIGNNEVNRIIFDVDGISTGPTIVNIEFVFANFVPITTPDPTYVYPPLYDITFSDAIKNTTIDNIVNVSFN